MRALKLLALLLMFTSSTLQAGAELVDPDPIVLSEGTPAQVKKAVKTSLLNRGWLLSNEKGNYVEGTYTKPKFWAKIGVSWEGRTVRIQYLASEGLDYEKDGDRREIHGNYIKWIRNLEKDIPIYLQREAMASE